MIPFFIFALFDEAISAAYQFTKLAHSFHPLTIGRGLNDVQTAGVFKRIGHIFRIAGTTNRNNRYFPESMMGFKRLQDTESFINTG